MFPLSYLLLLSSSRVSKSVNLLFKWLLSLSCCFLKFQTALALFILVILPLMLWSSKQYMNDRTYYISQPEDVSCDSVERSRKFYFTEPKSNPRHLDKAGYWVPNIVHYTWYTETPQPFRFHHMLSVLSAHRYIQPEVILFHTNMEPTGEFWDKVLTLPSLKVVKQNYTLCLNDQAIKKHWSKTGPSNVDRLRVLSETGGIYMDLDVIALRSFDPLRRFPCTVGLEKTNGPKVCSAVIVCSNQSLFLHYWREHYITDNRPLHWAYNSGQVPTDLWKEFPHLVHVENTSLLRPNFFELDQLWLDKPYDWRQNYAIHLWYHNWKHPNGYIDTWWYGSAGIRDLFAWGTDPTFENIRTWRGTFGEIARHVLYGSPQILKEGENPQLYDPRVNA